MTSVNTVNDDRLATEGARPVCGPWWLEFWWSEHRRFVRDLAETKAAYDSMADLVAAVEGRQEDSDELL